MTTHCGLRSGFGPKLGSNDYGELTVKRVRDGTAWLVPEYPTYILIPLSEWLGLCDLGPRFC